MALVGREPDVLDDLGRAGSPQPAADAPAGSDRVADVTDHDAAGAVVARLAEELGRVDVLHFNPSAYRPRTRWS